MSQGVPGVPPPKQLQDALASASSSSNSFGYCPADGEPAFREALKEEMKNIYGQDSDILIDDVALTAGCNLSFVATIMSLADAGDEVILPVPWYVHSIDIR
jgi:aspartate/methionine/tyrosine aminotransferase